MKIRRWLGACAALSGLLFWSLGPSGADIRAAVPPRTTPRGRSAAAAPRQTRFAADHLVLQLRARPDARLAPGNTGHASLNALMQRFAVTRIRPLTHPTRGNAQLKQRLGLDRLVVVDVPATTDLLAAQQAFALDPAVASAERDPIGTGAGTPGDPSFAQQWSLDNTGQSGGKADADIDAPEAWSLTTGSASVVIAVIDSGVDLDHPEFAGKLVPGYDFANDDATPQDDHGHGTHVAGIAAAGANNGAGVAGVCWKCRIMPLKALDSANIGQYSWWVAAIEYAVDNGADVINMSMGGGADWPPLHAAIQYAASSNVPVAVAMMNDNSSTPYYPAAYSEAIAVGATNHGDARAFFSSYGAHIDLVAPGTSILSTMWDNTYAVWDGTSMATPHVAGVLGLLESSGQSFTVDQLRALLQTTADDRVGPAAEDTAGWDMYFGAGRLNAARAVAAGFGAASTPTSTPTDTPTSTPTKTPTKTPTTTPTDTPTSTPTDTPTRTPTRTPAPASTPTATRTPSATPTATPPPPATAVVEPTTGETPTAQAVVSPTATPGPPRVFLPLLAR